jgi:hypothetical protein
MPVLYITADHSHRQMVGFPMVGEDGTQYPAYAVTEELLESLGMVRVPELPRPDDRFHLVESSPRADGTWASTPKPVEEVKAQLLAQVRTSAGLLLAPTDWMIVRKAETGTEVPADVAAWRALVRDHSNALEAKITTAKDISELEILELEGWPEAG